MFGSNFQYLPNTSSHQAHPFEESKEVSKKTSFSTFFMSATTTEHFNSESQFSYNSEPFFEPQNLNPENSNQSLIVYTTFEELPNYPLNTDLEVICNDITTLFASKESWFNHFNAIDNLRILNKYHPDELNAILSIFWHNIIESLDSGKTPILKNILMFCKELLFSARDHKISEQALCELIPVLVSKGSSEKLLIKQEIETIIEAITTFCCYDSSLQAFAKICIDPKRQNQHEIAFFALMKMADNIGTNLPKLDQFSLKCLMTCIGNVLESGKKGTMKKWGTLVCQTIYRLFGANDYLELVKTTVSMDYPVYEEALLKAVEDRKDSRRASNIGEFISEKKRLMKLEPLEKTHCGEQCNTFKGIRKIEVDSIVEESVKKKIFGSLSCKQPKKNKSIFSD